jgi:hypothetical protein
MLATHEQVISLRNAKVGQDARICVREPIPRAIDDKVKVGGGQLNIYQLKKRKL